MIKEANIPQRYINKNFSNYKVEPINEKAFEKVSNYLKDYKELAKKGQWLLMTGEYGIGKTHLSIAIMKKICYIIAGQAVEEYKEFPLSYFREKIVTRPVYFSKAPEFLEEIKSAYEYDNVLESDVLAKYKYKKFLVIDDLGSEKPSEWQQEKMYSILDYRYSNLKPTVITTNCDLNQLVNRIGQRVVDRIQEAAGEYITGWQGPSHRIQKSS